MINLNFNKVYKEVKDIIPKKTTLPQTQRVYFLEGNLWVTDTERALKVKMFEAEENKNFSISFEDIKRLKTIKNGIVDVDSKTVTEKGSVYSIDISTKEEDIFEMWDKAEKEMESNFEIGTYKNFSQILKCIYPFLDIKSSNKALSCVHINKGNTIEGTNGHKLIKAEMERDYNTLDTILSGMAFNTLKNLPEEEVKVKDSNKFVMVEGGSWKYFERKLELKYFNFNNMFNNLPEIESKISLDIPSFKEKLENAKKLKSKKPFIVVITKENEIYSICDNNVSKLEGEVVKETKSEKSLFVAFNPSYMLDVIKVKKENYEDKIELNLTNCKSPIYVDSNDGYINYYMLLLPVYITNGNDHIKTYNEQIKIIERFKDSIKFDEDVVKEAETEDAETENIEKPKETVKEDIETEDVETVKETVTENVETVKETVKEDIKKEKKTQAPKIKKIKLNGLEIEYTKTEEKHTRTQEKLFCVRIKTSLSRNEYIDIAALFRKLGGYYSKFKHAFIFKENIQLEELKEV